jgi:recombination associated protein RdgC
LEVKRLAFLDVLKEDAEKQVEGGDDLFEANFALMSGELPQLLAELAVALDGEAE